MQRKIKTYELQNKENARISYKNVKENKFKHIFLFIIRIDYLLPFFFQFKGKQKQIS